MEFKTLIVILSILLTANSFSQSKIKADCSVLKNCKLKYIEANDNLSYIIIKNNKLTEYARGRSTNYIMSDLKWINECEYNATVIKITILKTTFKIGDVLNVKYTKLEKGIAYYTASFKGKILTGKFKLVK